LSGITNRLGYRWALFWLGCRIVRARDLDHKETEYELYRIERVHGIQRRQFRPDWLPEFERRYASTKGGTL
jgi:hypothetical protein